MLYIQEKDGEVKSVAVCDKCGSSVGWNDLIGLRTIKEMLRKHKGRKMGKRHICAGCKKPQTGKAVPDE